MIICKTPMHGTNRDHVIPYSAWKSLLELNVRHKKAEVTDMKLGLPKEVPMDVEDETVEEEIEGESVLDKTASVASDVETKPKTIDLELIDVEYC